MKKRILAFITTVCALFSVVITASACGSNEPEFVDYAAQVSLDMSSDTVKQSVTVEAYIDGDTTHFNVPTSINSRGLLKARYLAVNTPESTGKIEEWGKKAANYTKTQLKNATEIIIESDDGNWNPDSTGERFLVWVWYKTSETDVYHNLNLELLQQGLAVGSKAASTRYGDQAVKAIDQANRFKLHVHSTDPDPDFYYGAAQELTLKELRLNIADYVGARVAFTGNVSQYDNQGVYVEEYDEPLQIGSVTETALSESALSSLDNGDVITVGYHISKDSKEICSISSSNNDILNFDNYLAAQQKNDRVGIIFGWVFFAIFSFALVVEAIHFVKTGKCVSRRARFRVKR